MKYRYRVLRLLFLLSMITFLDRVCLSVVGPRVQTEPHISQVISHFSAPKVSIEASGFMVHNLA